MKNTEMLPLLSILIPTKNRYDTLFEVVKVLSESISDNRLEIVISDDSTVDTPSERQRITELDTRVSYHYHGHDMSIVENVEKGISHCLGKYICFIGDDDIVSPHIMQIVEWLDAQGQDCLIYPPARYWWAGVKFAKESRYQTPGVFWLPTQRTGAVKHLSSITELASVRSRGGVAYLNLPRLYHGIASRRAVDKIVARFGRPVPGSSPDMALCMALAVTNEHYLSIDYPVTVFGASRNSGGGWTAARKHYGRIEDQKFLPRDILDNWDDRLPQIWSEQIIYPQTMHEVMSRLGQESGVSFPMLFGSLIAYEPHIFRHLWPILVKYARQKPSHVPLVLFNTVLKLAGRARMSFKRRTGWGMPVDLHNFPDVAAAMRFMKDLPPPHLK